ncbi:hypothetical protein [Chryseobacterium indoltheticum]|uniref:hypothetical protein n=1 Tax=Chryseobacterium indoltheticum TaxID=254 RepID=UPI003F494304
MLSVRREDSSAETELAVQEQVQTTRLYYLQYISDHGHHAQLAISNGAHQGHYRL